MSNVVKAVLALGLVSFVAACAPKQTEEVVYVEPVTAEPVYTGKYK